MAVNHSEVVMGEKGEVKVPPLPLKETVQNSQARSHKKLQNKNKVEPEEVNQIRAGGDNKTDEDDNFLQWMKTQFVELAGEDHSIDKEEFKKALGNRDTFFSQRFFSLFDSGNSGTIDLTEFIEAVTLLTKGTPQQKLKFLFDAYDINGNGHIEPEELKTVMSHCMVENNMKLSEDALESLTVALFDSADADKSGYITFTELCNVLEKHPDIMDNLSLSAAKWLKPPGREKTKAVMRKPKYLTSKYYLNNKKEVIWFIIYVIINIGLFLTCIRYRDSNWAVIIARGCGMCLNFNSALILVLMLNGTFTVLRMTFLRHFLPIDETVSYHKNVGYFIVALSIVHTVAHYVNVGLALDSENNANGTQTYWEFVFTLKSQVGYVGPGFAYLSGFLLQVILLLMFLFALPCIRRKGYFEVFYFTHLLYILFWILLTLHGPIFWCFFLVPAVVFIVEKVIPPLLRRATGTMFHITRVNLLPSKVTHLVISCKDFHFRPGDYVFINIPAVAKFEYHPFTISSAPERNGEFWLHIRSSGHWTNSLYKYFENYESIGSQNLTGRSLKEPKGSRKSQMKFWKDRMKTKRVNMAVSIRGPYGTPTREIFDVEHAVLIACGIGVTPFASILQSVVYQVAAKKKTCPHCDKTFIDKNDDDTKMKLKKVDFLWINRDQHSFEWFIQLLQELEDQEAEEESFDKFLDMQLYMTSALTANDMKGFGIQMALDVMQRKGQRNVVTGMKQSFKPGRPNWKQVFSNIKQSARGRVKVFFCGNPQLAKTLQHHCDQNNFDFSKESF